jgi:hypothetical protein
MPKTFYQAQTLDTLPDNRRRLNTFMKKALDINDLDLTVTETGSVISDINWRINALEQKGTFLGSF